MTLEEPLKGSLKVHHRQFQATHHSRNPQRGQQHGYDKYGLRQPLPATPNWIM